MASSTSSSMHGRMPIETYILRRDPYYKSYPSLPEHPYRCKVQTAPHFLEIVHNIIASTKLVENTLHDLDIKFNECHCFSRRQPNAKSEIRHPIISISASGNPDRFTSAAKLIWEKLGSCRRDEFTERMVVEIYDPTLMTSRERFDMTASVAVESGLSPLPFGLQGVRKQVNGWLQFTPCLMYAHCSASTEDDEPMPTLLVRCLHGTTADYGILEDDILDLLPRVQVIFEAITHLASDEATLRQQKQRDNSVTTLEAWKQTRYHRTHVPCSFSPRQWAIPYSSTVLGSWEQSFELDLEEVREQEEVDSWCDVDAVEVGGGEEEEEWKSAVGKVADWVKGSVWFDEVRKATTRVVLGKKDWRKW